MAGRVIFLKEVCGRGRRYLVQSSTAASWNGCGGMANHAPADTACYKTLIKKNLWAGL
jgi:hypothetical protein